MITSIVLAAALSTQISPKDYCFMKSQEDWIMDNLPKPKGYHKFLPKEIAEHVDMWHDPCYRCRRRANEAICAMGEPALRWMFWTLRSTSLQVRMHSEACIRGILKCSHCGGYGICQKYIPKEYGSNDYHWERCEVCGRGKEYHDDESTVRTCNHCSGEGIFEKPDSY